MAEQNYPYSIASDLPGGAVNTEKLVTEIQASAIVTALDRVDSSGDVLSIVFKAVLSSEDKTILDGDATGPAGGLLAAHDNTPSSDETQMVALDPTMRHTTEMQEMSPGDLVYHNFHFPELVIPSGQTEGHIEIVLPFNVWFLAIEYWAGPGSSIALGDKISSAGDPERDMSTLFGAYGYLTANAAAGQNQVQINTIMIGIGKMHPGYTLTFGTDTELYMIVSIDTTTGIVTLDKNLTVAFSLGDVIKRTICLGHEIWAFPSPTVIDYGQEKAGGSCLLATWPFRISLKACDSTGRRLLANLMASLEELKV